MQCGVNSADISTYNTFVNAEAALNPSLPSTTWYALASTPTVEGDEFLVGQGRKLEDGLVDGLLGLFGTALGRPFVLRWGMAIVWRAVREMSRRICERCVEVSGEILGVGEKLFDSAERPGRSCGPASFRRPPPLIKKISQSLPFQSNDC